MTKQTILALLSHCLCSKVKQNQTQASKHTAGEAGTMTQVMKKVCFIPPSKDDSVTVRNYLFSLFTVESRIVDFYIGLIIFPYACRVCASFLVEKGEKHRLNLAKPHKYSYFLYFCLQVPALTCHPEFLWSPSNTENRMVLLDNKVCSSS